MTDTFKEALLLSNKTYFLEEMSKQKGLQKQLKISNEHNLNEVKATKQENKILQRQYDQ